MSKKTSGKISADELDSYNLAAKYRPTNLDEFVGQEQALSTVQGWVKQKRFPQTLLVHGMTGSGKTTFARLLARIVNCRTMDACGECEYCRYEDNLPDVLEINAGTNGKVEDIDGILRAASQQPRYRRRIILVDEAHLLTDKAESNLLVPIEKPNKYTIWILCTTDPEKMKNTIKNRCTQIAIKPLAENIIADRLKQICILEKVKIKDKKAAAKALKVIASMSEGQMRNGISQLDALLSVVSSGKPFNEQSVMEISASVMNTDIDEYACYVLVAVLRNNLENVVRFVKKANDPRRLIGRVRYLIDWIIDNNLGIVPYVPAVGKIWQNICKKQESGGKPVDYSIASLVKVQAILHDVDYKILTTPAFPGNTALYTGLANLSIDNYFLTVQGKTEPSSPPEKKPKKKKD